MNRVSLALIVGAVVANSMPAQAEGLYVAAAGGVSYLQDADNRNVTPLVDVKSSYDRGWVVSGAVGYALPGGFRLEAEVAYRKVKVDELDIVQDGGLGVALGGGSLNGVTVAAEGHETALSVMANMWYDINTGTPFTPYIGGGIGFAEISLDKLSAAGALIVDGRDDVFAYQLGAGVGYAVTSNLTLTVDYRFFGTTNATFTDITGDFHSEVQNHSVMGGLRFTF